MCKMIYNLGDRFQCNETEYILAQVAPGTVTLINLVDGNRWVESILVNDVRFITEIDFSKISGGNLFTKI